MSVKPIRPRERAHRDVEDIVAYYEQEAGTDVALDFVAALEAGYQAIGLHPGIGSPRLIDLPDIPDLRGFPVRRFPHIVIYIERFDHIDVVRVLHARRDFPAQVRESGD